MLKARIEQITNAMNLDSFISMFIVPFLFATGKIDEKKLNELIEKEDVSNCLKEILGSDND